jgi:hypothetical protein
MAPCCLQINDALAQPTGLTADLDEDELLGELEELEAQELDKQLLAPAPVPAGRAPAAAAKQQAPHAALPSAPQGRVPAAASKTPEELELEQLQAEMAL